MAGIPGQGRKFDIDQALDIAMEQFWTHGYEGTSVSTLTAAMGISPPSLYAAFGGKRQLFDRVVDHYLGGKGAWMDRAFEEETSTVALVRRLLAEAAVNYADPAQPGGCLVITAGTMVTDANADIAEALRLQRNNNIDRLEMALRSGDLPSGIDPRAAAEFLGVAIQGMSTRARDGASVDQLLAAGDLVLRSLGVSPSGEQLIGSRDTH